MTHLIELFAVAASGTYGVLLARSKRMDFVGVFSVAFVTAFGGGTLRDLFLDRHPLFWIRHDEFVLIVFGLALATSFFKRLSERIKSWMVLPDAIGLGLFSILGAGFALEAGTSWFIAALLGVITGTFGGVIAEVICNELPSLFTSAPLYATCAFAGACVYIGLAQLQLPAVFAPLTGATAVVVLRLLAVRFDLRLPNHS